MESHVYDLMRELEETYWWYWAKRRLVVRFVRHWLRPRGPLAILDIGCGTGATLSDLAQFGTTSGCDIEPKAVAYSRGRGLTDITLQADPSRLPYSDDRFDLVTSLEMLEHVDDDEGMLREAARVLHPGGTLLLSVPAFPALWSVHDEAAHHRRRYRRAELLGKLRRAGFAPVRVTYLNALLLPLIVPVRWLRDRWTRGRKVTTDFDIRLPAWLDAFFARVFFSEWAIVRFGSLPFGLSLCCLARKVVAADRSQA